jgi:hypothetical protein
LSLAFISDDKSLLIVNKLEILRVLFSPIIKKEIKFLLLIFVEHDKHCFGDRESFISTK